MINQTESRAERMAEGLGVDTRLIAAVQSRAGARCHEAANLMHCYLGWAACQREATIRNDNELAEEARRCLLTARTAMRQFLFEASGCQLSVA